MGAKVHFYEPATSTIAQSHIRGYGVAGWYFFSDELEAVLGPFPSFEEAEDARHEHTLEGQSDR